MTIQCDELWSFVDNKGNKQWVWLALDEDNREITDSGTSANSRLPKADKISVISISEVHITKIRGIENPLSLDKKCNEKLFLVLFGQVLLVMLFSSPPMHPQIL